MSPPWRSECVKARVQVSPPQLQPSPAEPSPASRIRSRSVLLVCKAFACVAGVSPQVLVAKRRTVVAKRSRVSRVCRHKSWSRNAELSSLLASPTVTGMRGVPDEGSPGRETQNCRRFWPRVVSSCLESKATTSPAWSRYAELSSLLASCRVVASQVPTVTGMRGVLVEKRSQA